MRKKGNNISYLVGVWFFWKNLVTYFKTVGNFKCSSSWYWYACDTVPGSHLFIKEIRQCFQVWFDCLAFGSYGWCETLAFSATKLSVLINYLLRSIFIHGGGYQLLNQRFLPIFFGGLIRPFVWVIPHLDVIISFFVLCVVVCFCRVSILRTPCAEMGIVRRSLIYYSLFCLL